MIEHLSHEKKMRQFPAPRRRKKEVLEERALERDVRRVRAPQPHRLRDLVAEATLVRLGNRVGVARIQVWQEADEGGAEEGGRRLVAEGTGVYAVRRS